MSAINKHTKRQKKKKEKKNKDRFFLFSKCASYNHSVFMKSFTCLEFRSLTVSLQFCFDEIAKPERYL